MGLTRCVMAARMALDEKPGGCSGLAWRKQYRGRADLTVSAVGPHTTEDGELVKIRRLVAVGLLGMGMSLVPFATGVASADPGNGNGPKPGQDKNCTPRGKHNHYPPGQCKGTLSASEVDRGSSVNAFTEGWQGLTNVDYELHSDVTALGTTQADANGDNAATLTIPCSVSPGQHTVVANGVLPDGSPFTQSMDLKVSNKACVLGESVTNTAAAPAAASGTTTKSSLPFTGGVATTLLATVAVALIAAGSVALTAARRRRTV